MKAILNNATRLVIKVGSSLVTNDGMGLDRNALSIWAEQIAYLKQEGKEVVLVSSGAIAEGMQRLGWEKRPHAVHDLQAAAAVGQMGLIQAYESCFAQLDMQTAQILLTHDDLSDRKRYLNARVTLQTLLGLGVVPIINENDTVVTDEIRFGDNDTLAALVTNLIEGDVLIILTDQDGLYTADPRVDLEAKFVHQAKATDPTLLKMAGGVGSKIGTGGMLSKIIAAKRAARSGAHTIIASGREKNVLVRMVKGEQIGTQLIAPQMKLAARKQWLADHLQIRGQVVIDQGAANAIRHEGKSLLPVGVCGIVGDFDRGEIIACIDQSGNVIAHGVVNYNSSESRKILRVPSHEIESILGYIAEEELIHRDNLAIL